MDIILSEKDIINIYDTEWDINLDISFDHIKELLDTDKGLRKKLKYYFYRYSSVYYKDRKNEIFPSRDINIRSDFKKELDETINFYNLYKNGSFLNIKYLYLNDSGLDDALDLVCLVNLKVLNCHYNHISEIYIHTCQKLKKLDCSFNSIGELDLRYNKELKYLNCSDNSLTSLNLENNLKLISLTFNYNKIKNINLTNNTQLEYLDCHYNPDIEYIDLSKNINLKHLNVFRNSIEILDVSNNHLLQDIDCSENIIKNLIIDDNKFLYTLRCGDNQIETLNLKKCLYLTTLYCYSNKLKELDLSNNKNIKALRIEYNDVYLIADVGHLKLKEYDIEDC